MRGILDAADVLPSYNAQFIVPTAAQDMAALALGAQFKPDRRQQDGVVAVLEAQTHWQYESTGSSTNEDGEERGIDERLHMDTWHITQRANSLDFALRLCALFEVPCALSVEHPTEGVYEEGHCLTEREQGLHFQHWDSRLAISAPVWAQRVAQAQTLEDLMHLKEIANDNAQESQPSLTPDQSAALLPVESFQRGCTHATLFARFMHATQMRNRYSSMPADAAAVVSTWTQDNALEAWVDTRGRPMLDNPVFWQLARQSLLSVYDALPAPSAWAFLSAQMHHWHPNTLALSGELSQKNSSLCEWDTMQTRFLQLLTAHPELASNATQLESISKKMDSFSFEQTPLNAQQEHRELVLSQRLHELYEKAAHPERQKPVAPPRNTMRL